MLKTDYVLELLLVHFNLAYHLREYLASGYFRRTM